MAETQEKQRVVIVGAGFAGFNAARELSKLAGATTEIVVINSTDYFLYLPLMPQVSGGLIEPGHIRISLPRRLRKTRFVLGTVNHVDPCYVREPAAGADGLDPERAHVPRSDVGRRHQRRVRAARRKQTASLAKLGSHGAQPFLQEALFGLAGRQGHCGVKFTSSRARAAKPAQVVRQGGVPQM
jgi:hypothetical protein